MSAPQRNRPAVAPAVCTELPHLISAFLLLAVTVHGAGVTLWDVSGAYAFIGSVAGILSDPQQVLES